MRTGRGTMGIKKRLLVIFSVLLVFALLGAGTALAKGPKSGSSEIAGRFEATMDLALVDPGEISIEFDATCEYRVHQLPVGEQFAE